jgi:hypothetical protein
MVDFADGRIASPRILADLQPRPDARVIISRSSRASSLRSAIDLAQVLANAVLWSRADSAGERRARRLQDRNRVIRLPAM